MRVTMNSILTVQITVTPTVTAPSKNEDSK